MAGEIHAGISEIRLYTGLNEIHLEVKTAGIWYEVIHEPKDQKFDHRVTAEEIRRLYLQEKAGGSPIEPPVTTDGKENSD